MVRRYAFCNFDSNDKTLILMIVLNKSLYIGEGDIRTCYEHPEDKSLCVKVPKPHVTREYTFKEILYFKKLAKRRSPKFKTHFFSDFHGEFETNLGVGQVFDLVRDETTGEISKTLEYYLTQSAHDIKDDTLWNALLLLKEQMTNHRVFTRDLRARNLCCKINTDSSIEIIIIDGIGHRDFFPLADLFHYFSKKKVERTFSKWYFDNLNEQREFLIRDKG